MSNYSAEAGSVAQDGLFTPILSRIIQNDMRENYERIVQSYIHTTPVCLPGQNQALPPREAQTAKT